MKPAEVEIVLDSISIHGKRMTTFKVRYWRGIHSEALKHRVLSQSSGSSRARPTMGIVKQLMADPWGPMEWGSNQAGMQAGKANTEAIVIPAPLVTAFAIYSNERRLPEQTDAYPSTSAQEYWRFLAWMAGLSGKAYFEAGYHKQIANRPMEPYTFIDVVMSGTDWQNFFVLREHEMADPTIYDLACRMRRLYDKSQPQLLKWGEWHLPFITPDDHLNAMKWLQQYEFGKAPMGITSPMDVVIRISVARCARTSYRAFDGNVAPLEDDLILYHDLIIAQPVHATPSEHQATPDDMEYGKYVTPEKHGNLSGWIQNRKLIHNEWIPG